MKKTIYTVIATLLFLISSCTLEQEVYNKINPGMFPQNAEDVNALVNSSKGGKTKRVNMWSV
ncbi:hypothetical protein [Bacteroides caccae]|uniref:RagB/SusD family nutrient uptake outer membrane protein n=1 Tax=Bacteroides caccae TaxID=47678 RepID=A0A6H9Q8E7_9BACE|nr:hypothetical protein [Bacteroides caccae]KAA5475968.1 hypothetical protein F2Y39_13820 [Bacteroides caccae]KAA5482957.1 hypothetical protein F2Y33_16990 [Bacteroides caccae]